MRDLWHETREALTIATKGSIWKALLVLVLIFLAAVGLYVLISYFFPEEQLEQYAEYGYSAVFLVTLISSLSVVLPLPGTVVVLAAAKIWNPWLVALVASLGGTLGELSGYGLGYGGRAVFSLDKGERYEMARDWMKRRGGFAVWLFAFIPFFIFDFIGVAAGVFRYPVHKFLLYAWLGRLPRSMIEVAIGAPLLGWFSDRLPF